MSGSGGVGESLRCGGTVQYLLSCGALSSMRGPLVEQLRQLKYEYSSVLEASG